MRQSINLILLLMLSFGAVSCKHPASQGVTKSEETVTPGGSSQPEMTFTTKEHNFGKITEGERVGWYFKFRNTGGSDLVITHASASCGCTIPEYDHEPVPPGGEGTVKVVFDSSGREGRQFKTVTIESNASRMITKLELRANVIKKNKS